MFFERDLFISYASLDDLSIKKGGHGWVNNFQKALEMRLSQLLGEKPRVWRAPKLQGSDVLSLKPDNLMSKTAVMLPILSPRYIKSEWCMKELREFYENSNGGISDKIDRKSRIFKLIKAAVPYDDHPRVITDNLAYEFYIIDSATGKANELNQDSRGELDQIYWARLDDIAHDICDVLEKISRIEEKDIPPPEEKLKIYLAETCSELKEQRDMIRRELNEAGYEVLPEYRLSSNAAEFKESVDQLLDECILSIHLVGGSYGPVPKGSQRSIVEVQNEIAVTKSKTRNLPRLIWLLPDSDEALTDERQKRFVHLVRRDAETQYGADMFETSLEDIKYAIDDKLENIKSGLKTLKETGEKECKKEEEKEAPAPMKAGERTGAPPQIYLICDKRDLDHITELEDFLYSSEFDVVLPAFEGEEEDLIRDHLENLKCCDAAVIYYGAGNDLWMRSISRDFRKIAGYGRTRPLLGRAIYLAPPAVKAKEHLRYHDWQIIDGMKGFLPESVTPFVKILKITTKS